MKKFLLLLALPALMSTASFGAANLSCNAEDGSAIKAIVNNQAGSVPTQITYRIRGSELKPGTTLHYISSKTFLNGSAGEEKIKTFAIRDAKTKHLAAVITNDSFIDKTGVYSVSCSFEY